MSSELADMLSEQAAKLDALLKELAEESRLDDLLKELAEESRLDDLLRELTEEAKHAAPDPSPTPKTL